MNNPECPLCNGKCTIQMSYTDGFEYVQNIECNECHGVYREVYTMQIDRVETLIKPTRRTDNG